MRVVAVVVLSLILAESAMAQADVMRIVDASGASVESTSEVSVTPFGAMRPVAIQRGARLRAGDELRSNSGRAQVVIMCPDSAEFMLEGAFRVALAAGRPGKTCLVNLMSGRAYVTGDTTTGLGVGDVTLGAKRTRYSVSVALTGDRVQRDVEVFDGEVEVGGSSVPQLLTVTAGQWLTVAPSEVPRPTTDSRIQETARLFARIDASRVDAERRAAATETLTARYAEVLANPGRPEARIRLVEQQVQLNATGNNTLYELRRVRATAPANGDMETATAVLSLAAYTQLGRNDLISTQQLTSLQRFDAAGLDQALRRFIDNPAFIRSAGRLEERLGRTGRGGRGATVPASLGGVALLRDSLRVTVSTQPATIRAGTSTTVTVMVANQSGAVAGAAVRIDVGGGAFRTGGTSASGVTNSDGVFSASWSCSACAASYEITVRATKDQIVGQTTFQVRIPQ